MQRNQEDNQCDFFEYFPYKTYEEIQQFRRRRIRRRKSILLFTCLFFLMSFVLINVGLKISGQPLLFFGGTATEPVSDVKVNSFPQTSLSASSNGAGMKTDGFQLPISSAQEETQVILVKDVSAIVRRVRLAVVGVTCEIYSSFTQTSSGSGIIMSENGYIITNNHVIANGDSISVTLDNGDTFPAYVIGTDELTDLAVLKIEAEGLEVAEFGDSDLVEAGQAAIAIGNPTGQLQGSVTAGIISAVNRNVVVGSTVMNLIQTDAAINKGNSGGPLLNQYGQVVGVNSLKMGSTTGFEGISFAIPTNTVKPIVEQLVSKGYVSGRPLLGISGIEISKMSSAFYSIPQGILIESIDETSGMGAAGVAAGDVIIGLNGERVYGLSDAGVIRNSLAAGDEITVTIYRKGRQYDVVVKLIEQSQDNSDCNF